MTDLVILIVTHERGTYGSSSNQPFIRPTGGLYLRDLFLSKKKTKRKLGSVNKGGNSVTIQLVLIDARLWLVGA